MDYNHYLNKIVAFNCDKDVIKLRDKLNQPSFFEIISKERSETTYSAFLKWLILNNNPGKESCNPLSLLLDILVRRYEEQKGYVESILSNESLTKNLLTRKLTVYPARVETEKSVSSLTQEIRPLHRRGVIGYADLASISAKSEDHIDLFLDCEIECEDPDITASRMQIIIENKINSGEGEKKQKGKTGVAKYDDAPQTVRHYLGTKFSSKVGNTFIDGEEVLQVYVYLTSENPRQGGCADNHFVQINYQDIVDGILVPMLASSLLPDRSRLFIQEFLSLLVSPSRDGKPTLAQCEQYSEELYKIWERHKVLLADAAAAVSETALWKIADTLYDHQPRTELLDALLAKGVDSPAIVDGKWKAGTPFKKMKDLALAAGITAEMVNLDLDDKTLELLQSFWDKNQRFLMAIINGMTEAEHIKVKALLSHLSKRDTTKYNVYYDNVLLNEKPLGKAQTVFCIISKWVDLQTKAGNPVTLDILNNTFPLSFNPYYAHGKWFKHLFYEAGAIPMYDGTEAEGEVQGNWDFDKKGRFDIPTTDGKTVTMLKMWRKDALECLIEKIGQSQLFDKSLDVVAAG